MEDDPINLVIMIEILTTSGYKVLSASDGQLGLEDGFTIWGTIHAALTAGKTR